MAPGPTFERVYRALKQQLGNGRFPAGQHLEPAALSHALNASITPVRDALHRLAGEGLVDTARGEGFRTPPVTELGLRHLYRWNGAVLALAARRGRGKGESGEANDIAAPETAVAATESLFEAVAAHSRNVEHVAAVVRLNERLRPVRHAELRLFPDPAAELEEIAARLAQGALAELRRAMAGYHRRRERWVPDIVAALVAPR